MMFPALRFLLAWASLDVAAAIRRKKKGDAGARAGGLSTDFRQWLSASSFSSWDFARDDISGGSFGGRAYSGEALLRRPVVFVHGNSDRAMGGSYNGWEYSRNYFLSQGYTSAELYATTWGPANAASMTAQYHSKFYVTKTRAFLQAVLAYTGAAQIDVIGHSMGVTLSRKAILGGSAEDVWQGGRYDLGSALTASVHTFVGISGQNRGMGFCLTTGASTPVCSVTAGHWPGLLTFGVVTGRSQFLNDLRDARSGFEGRCRYSMGSTTEQIAGFGPNIYGLYTWRFPGTTDEVIYNYKSHSGTKDETWITQFNLVNTSC